MIVPRIPSISLLIKYARNRSSSALFQHMVREQLFVKRTGDFGHKDRVIVILVRLCLS